LLRADRTYGEQAFLIYLYGVSRKEGTGVLLSSLLDGLLFLLFLSSQMKVATSVLYIGSVRFRLTVLSNI
jgi:hypothetical protein